VEANAQLRRVDIARRFVALLLVAASLLLPGGAMPAVAMPGATPTDHAAMADCPHASTVMTPQQPTSHPAGLPAMSSCCHAVPALLVELLARREPVEPRSLPKPISDAMPAAIAIGPDVPPPRA
jgi:hypothetical protein